MNGRGKSARLCLVFALAGVLTVMCLARTSVSIPPGVSHYLDIVMAVLMVVLLMCVLELCLGVELCASSCCTRRRAARDAEAGVGDSGLTVPESGEAPPSYEVIMAEGGAGTHAGAAAAERGGRTRGRGRECEPLKRDVSLYFKRHFLQEDGGPPVRGGSERLFLSGSELWLSVDSLPTYEEAVARLREEEVTMQLQEEAVAQLQDEETRTRLRDVTQGQLQMMARLRDEEAAQLEEEEEEEEEGRG